MRNTTSIVAGSALLLIIIGMFVFTYLKRQEIQQGNNAPVTQNKEVASPFDSIERIDAKHFFENGKHTLVGEIEMPTSCDLLNWDTIVSKSMPEEVQVKFSVVNHTQDCEKVPTSQRFKVDFTASAEARIGTKLEGRTIELNLIPPAPGETPESYELFLKG